MKVNPRARDPSWLPCCYAFCICTNIHVHKCLLMWDSLPLSTCDQDADPRRWQFLMLILIQLSSPALLLMSSYFYYNVSRFKGEMLWNSGDIGGRIRYQFSGVFRLGQTKIGIEKVLDLVSFQFWVSSHAAQHDRTQARFMYLVLHTTPSASGEKLKIRGRVYL